MKHRDRRPLSMLLGSVVLPWWMSVADGIAPIFMGCNELCPSIVSQAGSVVSPPNILKQCGEPRTDRWYPRKKAMKLYNKYSNASWRKPFIQLPSAAIENLQYIWQGDVAWTTLLAFFAALIPSNPLHLIQLVTGTGKVYFATPS